MATYLCVKANNSTKSYTANQSKEAGKPYLCVKASNSVGYFPLTTETGTGTNVKIKASNGSTYRIIDGTYTTTQQITVTTGTSYLTRSSTSNTTYRTRKSTSKTSYLTRSSTSKTTYGTMTYNTLTNTYTTKDALHCNSIYYNDEHEHEYYVGLQIYFDQAPMDGAKYGILSIEGTNINIPDDRYKYSVIMSYTNSRRQTLTTTSHMVTFSNNYTVGDMSITHVTNQTLTGYIGQDTRSYTSITIPSGVLNNYITHTQINYVRNQILSNTSMFSMFSLSTDTGSTYMRRNGSGYSRSYLSMHYYVTYVSGALTNLISTTATGYLTKKSTSRTTYYTRSSTSSTSYLTRSSTYDTSYLTTTSTEQITV